MSVNQVILEIPLDIQRGLDAGIYIRHGSVIRNTSGHIVKHLKEVKVAEPAKQAAKGLVKNKYLVTGAIGAGVLVVGGAGYYLFNYNRYKRAAKKIIEKLVHFIQLAQKGKLSEQEVDDFLKYINNNKKVLLTMNLDSTIDELFELMYDYTIQFAEANNFETRNISRINNNNKVINLIDYLELQKEIYKSDYI
ncbi:TPA: hypothetical protein ACGORW_000156 [Streptococcus suis]